MTIVTVLRAGLCMGMCLLSLSSGAMALWGERQREMEGAVQGNQDRKIDKWLIAFTLGMARDRDKNMKTLRNRASD